MTDGGGTSTRQVAFGVSGPASQQDTWLPHSRGSALRRNHCRAVPPTQAVERLGLNYESQSWTYRTRGAFSRLFGPVS